MVRHADTEMIVEGTKFTHSSLETGCLACHTGPQVEALGLGGRRNEGETGARAFIVVQGVRKENKFYRIKRGNIETASD